ncbi:MAG: hypothetical protein ABI885_30665 [Gammaproteobacteria bacterium]
MDRVLIDQAALFRRIRPWKDFLPEVSHILPSAGSLRWFIRCHEQELLASGAVLKLARGIYIDPERFSVIAITLMQESMSCGSSA